MKGPRELLDADTRQCFTGICEHALGFEALTTDSNCVREAFGERVLFERASLDDIMLYRARREQK